MTPARRANLERLFAPRHAAFLGGRDAEIAVGEARRIGFRGAIWPVNPRRETMGGVPCFASLDALPEAPDAVFLAVPAPAAVETAKALAAMGAGGIVCYTAGFREGGPDGAALERALIEAVGEMALIGPNCYGLISYLDRTALWPFAHGGWCPGFGAAIVTQSGMLSSDLTMADRSVPLTHMLSVGNQAVIGIEDLVEHFAGMAEVRAIGLHIEGLADPGRFAEAALGATEGGTPVVALKTGSSAIGRALTVSHTGTLSGEDALYDALFDRVGVIRVRTPAELLETLKLLTVAGPPKGPRLAGFTCSGGGATMLADHAEPLGLSFPAFPAEIEAALRERLPAVSDPTNPLDYGTPIWGQPERTHPVFAAAMAAPADAALLVQDYPAPGLDESAPFYRADGDAFARAARAARLPAAICATLSENFDAASRRHFAAMGVAPMQGLAECMTAFAGGARWRAAADRIGARRPGPLFAGPSGALPLAADEVEGKAALAAAGIATPEGRVAGIADVAEAAEAVGFPVALKMVSARLPHKTEAGAVALGLGSGNAVREAAGAMRARVARTHPEGLSERFLVERMAPEPLAELVVACRWDPGFGLVLTVGSGGILVELVGDAATLLWPVEPADIAEAVSRLRVARLLAGFRGRPKADLGALAAQIHRLGAHVAASGGAIAEIEINPLFVYAETAVAVDVLMHRAALDAAIVPAPRTVSA